MISSAMPHAQDLLQQEQDLKTLLWVVSIVAIKNKDHTTVYHRDLEGVLHV